MDDYKNEKKLLHQVLRALIEMGFITFLFYSNLLMGEYDRSGNGTKKNLAWALGDIFTISNFEIAVAASVVGYLVFEFLRRKL
jgi:dolichol kinase